MGNCVLGIDTDRVSYTNFYLTLDAVLAGSSECLATNRQQEIYINILKLWLSSVIHGDGYKAHYMMLDATSVISFLE